MAALVDIGLLTLALAALVPALVLFVELLLGSSSRLPPAVDAATTASRPRVTVLMPAHDEEAGIADALRALLPQLAPGDRILVVADNCSDTTAATARGLGADVVERRDEARRGKGYALDFGVRSLAAAPPDMVVIVDADCVVEPGSLAVLVASCAASDRPVQALYLMHAPAGASLSSRVAQFAWVVRNKVRPAGAARLGWPCQLMGSGMAFPWQVLASASLASGHLVEDMQLGLDLACAGKAPLFCPQARVTSVFPADREAMRVQRTRWEHGHMATIVSAAPRLLRHAATRREFAPLAMLLDLIVPPLAAMAIALVVLALVTAAAWGLGASPLPLSLVALALGLTIIGVARAWQSDGRQIINPSELTALPLYAVAKIPIYVRLLTRRQTQWVRTRRDERKP